MTEETRPINGWPGYVITRSGKILSTRNSRSGFAKELKPSSRGTVTLSRQGATSQLRVSELLRKAWEGK